MRFCLNSLLLSGEIIPIKILFLLQFPNDFVCYFCLLFSNLLPALSRKYKTHSAKEIVFHQESRQSFVSTPNNDLTSSHQESGQSEHPTLLRTEDIKHSFYLGLVELSFVHHIINFVRPVVLGSAVQIFHSSWL